MKLFVLLVKQTHKNIQSTTEKKKNFFFKIGFYFRTNFNDCLIVAESLYLKFM